MPIIDYYKILEVAESATRSEIRNSYVKKIKKWHPDRAPAGKKKQYNDKAKLINAAWATLSDSQKRKEYDMKRRTGDEVQGDSSFFESQDYFGNIFNSFMGQNIFGGQNIFSHDSEDSSSYTQPTRQIHQLDITLKDLFQGVEKSFVYNQKKRCGGCQGRGRTNESRQCKTCNGRGYVRYSTMFGGQIGLSRCNQCRGTGFISEMCSLCNGRGTANSQKNIVKFIIPKRFNIKNLIKFKGKGRWRPKNNKYGDLYVKLNITDPVTIDGLDIKYECTKKYSELREGKFVIEMPDGRLNHIKIPKNFVTSKNLRIKKAGLTDGHDVGSVVIKLNILFDI